MCLGWGWGGSQWKTQDVKRLNTKKLSSKFTIPNSMGQCLLRMPPGAVRKETDRVCGQQKSWRNSSFRGNVFNSTLFLLIFLIFHFYMCAEYICIYIYACFACMYVYLHVKGTYVTAYEGMYVCMHVC